MWELHLLTSNKIVKMDDTWYVHTLPCVGLSSKNAIMRWRSSSLACTKYCRLTVISMTPGDKQATMLQYLLIFTKKFKECEPVHFHDPKSSTRTSLRFFNCEISITKATLFSTETGWELQINSFLNIGSHNMWLFLLGCILWQDEHRQVNTCFHDNIQFLPCN